MDLKQQAKLIISRLEKLYPSARTALNWSNPFELLVAVVLSAQCTDERVNLVTKELFTQYRSVADYARAGQPDLEKIVKPTGFFRNKAKNIIGAARLVLTEFNGEVPGTMEEIQRLPGIARKSANIILAEAYGSIEGVPVDTHVRRLTNRLGLTEKTDPDKIEVEMVRIVKPADWYKFSSVLIYHGRRICRARRPQCDLCVLADICPSAFNV